MANTIQDLVWKLNYCIGKELLLRSQVAYKNPVTG